MIIKQNHIDTHSISVGNVMKNKCLSMGLSKEYADSMFVLGYLHDIGKELGYGDNHACKGGELLHNLRYPYRQEVFYHGQANIPYSSPELKLLNEADLQVMQDGHIVSVETRLKDIGERYGFDSQVYEDAKFIAKQLNLL